MNFTPYISMDACAGNVTDVCKIGQELLMSVRNFSQCVLEQKKSVLRYFNGVDHFYTTYFFEIGTALFGQIGNFSYKAEGVQCILKTEPRRDLVPLFRYFNGQDHFYTTDPDEIGTTLPGVIGRYGYQYEHIPGYCYRKREQDTVPLYRYCNLVDHFYTTNPDEIRTIVRGEYGRFGYRYEGVVCYVLPYVNWPLG
ncbi:hypothetical protein EMCRGX_G023126 [Ephydatia muelleri]